MVFESELTGMSNHLTYELSKEQRDTLLRGLRYVRSSIMLTPEDPKPDTSDRRGMELQRVAMLAELLEGQPIAQETSV